MMYAPENQNSNERESAAQMSGKNKADKEWADCLNDGILKSVDSYKNKDGSISYAAAYGRCLALIECLVSKNAGHRAYARKEIAKHIKTGRSE